MQVSHFLISTSADATWPTQQELSCDVSSPTTSTTPSPTSTTTAQEATPEPDSSTQETTSEPLPETTQQSATSAAETTPAPLSETTTEPATSAAETTPEPLSETTTEPATSAAETTPVESTPEPASAAETTPVESTPEPASAAETTPVESTPEPVSAAETTPEPLPEPEPATSAPAPETTPAPGTSAPDTTPELPETTPEPAFQPLTCRGCSAGFYLSQETGNCSACPAGSSTHEFTNASSEADCICRPGWEPRANESSCVPCPAGTHKATLSNASCGACPEHHDTVEAGAEDESACVCMRGFTLAASANVSDVNASNASDSEWNVNASDSEWNVNASDSEWNVNASDSEWNVNASDSEWNVNASDSEWSVNASDRDSVRNASWNATPECVPCEAGFFKDAPGPHPCELCVPDHYCPRAAANPRPCPANSSSPAGSVSVHACQCAEGLVLVLAGDTYKCQPCHADTYYARDSATAVGVCLACQPGSSSPAGSRSERDCVCKPGFVVESAAAVYTCTGCTAGTFSATYNASQCTLCPAGKFSAAVEAPASSACTACAAGTVALSDGMSACVPCPASTWHDVAMPGSLSAPCTPCPLNSAHELSGVFDILQCQCTQGMYKQVNGSTFTCTECEAGYSCSESAVSVVMSFTLAVPLTVETFTPSLQLEFREAVAASAEVDVQRVVIVSITEQGGRRLLSVLRRLLSTGLDVEFSIILDSTGNVSAVEPPTVEEINTELESRDIAPVVMVVEPSITVVYQKELCPAGSFCAGGEQVFSCRPFSRATLGAFSQEQCLCEAGYYSLNTTAPCNKCPPGSFCVGGLQVQTCPTNAFSNAGAESAKDCFCNPGHWRNCTRTRSGSFVNNTGQPCSIRWTAPCVLCRANDICYNDTLLHCPAFSVSAPGSSLPEHCECLAGYAEENLTHAEDGYAEENLTHAEDGYTGENLTHAEEH